MIPIDSGKFRIAKADHEKALRPFTKILQYQQAHPEIYYYTWSRSYFKDAEDNPDHDIWMFIDDYDDRQKYWESLQNALKNNPASAEHFREFMELVVPDAKDGSALASRETWTELEELRVQFNRLQVADEGRGDLR